MEKIWVLLIAISLFVIFTYGYWKLTSGYAEKEYGKNMWKQWSTRTFYWNGAILVSGCLTFLTMYALNSANILIF